VILYSLSNKGNADDLKVTYHVTYAGDYVTFILPTVCLFKYDFLYSAVQQLNDFNLHSASRGISAVAGPLVINVCLRHR